jgi:two-component system sensor histidine kinase MtrB
VNGGLRSRLITGFIAVTAVTVLISSVTAVIGALFVYTTHPIGSAEAGRRVLGARPFSSMSDQDLIWVVAVAGLGLLAISVGAGWLVAQRMLQPVRTLAQAAEQVAAGDLTVRLQPSGNDELAQLVVTFNAMTSNLDRSMTELRRMEAHSRRFASDVSHELRSPLAAMTAVTEVLSDGAGDMSGPAGQASRLVVQEIANLDRLVNDLIEMSRFDAGTAVLDVDVVDVANAVQSCLALRGWTAAVAVTIPAGLTVTLDRRRFDVIVANLVGNALRHGAPPVEVLAGLDPGSGGLVLSVSDHGAGISPEALPHIFERFYKEESARTRSDGSGLGLAIALQNARLHGGDLVAANRTDGPGAVLTLVLPAEADVSRAAGQGPDRS